MNESMKAALQSAREQDIQPIAEAAGGAPDVFGWVAPVPMVPNRKPFTNYPQEFAPQIPGEAVAPSVSDSAPPSHKYDLQMPKRPSIMLDEGVSDSAPYNHNLDLSIYSVRPGIYKGRV